MAQKVRKLTSTYYQQKCGTDIKLGNRGFVSKQNMITWTTMTSQMRCVGQVACLQIFVLHPLLLTNVSNWVDAPA